MRMAGRFSRRVRGYAKAHGILVIDCPAGQCKHDLAEEYLAKTTLTHGLFLVLVGRAQAPVWDVNARHHIERKKPMPYVNHYSFHILDPDWGHLTIKISGHPPFPARVMLNGSRIRRHATRASRSRPYQERELLYDDLRRRRLGKNRRHLSQLQNEWCNGTKDNAL